MALLLPLQGFASALPFCVSTVHPAHHEASYAGSHDHTDAPAAGPSATADDGDGSSGASHNHDLCFSAALPGPAIQLSLVPDAVFAGTAPPSQPDFVPGHPKRPPLA